MKKLREIISLVLVLLCIPGMAWGCKSLSGNSQGNSQDISGYVEETVKMPKALEDNKESIFGTSLNVENKQVLFTLPTSGEISGEVLKQYTASDDGSFQDADRTYDISALPAEGYIISVRYGLDGKLYVLANMVKGADGIPQLYVLNDTNKFEKINIPDLEQKNEYGYYALICDFHVMPNGYVVMELEENQTYPVYDTKSGEQVYEIETFQGSKVGGSEKGIFAINPDGNAVLQYDLSSGTKISEIPVDFEQSFRNDKYSIQVKDDIVYIFTNTGIYSLELQGNRVKILFNGQNGYLCTPNLISIDGSMDASNVFYIKYQENDKVTFMKYKFSDKVPYSSKKTLSVFSLEQDEMIQAAIMTFREKNPDVIVKYNVAANQDNSLKKEDYIKNLNTELIAGEGADIIIGDGLPVDKYISKGVFADITDIVQSFTKDNKCFTNVSDNYQVDGKYYMFPMKFSPCIWIGKKDALDAVSDLEKCVEYKNKEHMLFGSGIGTDVNFSILYKQNYENLVNSDGMLDTEKAVKFLNQVKELNEVSGFMDGSFNDWVIKDYVCALLLSQANVVYSEVMDVDSLLMYDALMKETNTAMIPAGNKFVPRTCVSINNKSKEKDLAKQFIELLFTKEIQSKREGLGIPMNREAYESGWGDASMYNNEISIGASDYEDVYIVAKEPVNEDIRNEFQELVSGATVPVDYDSTIYELVKGYLSEFINGSITAEQVVTEVNKKASIYLKE